VPKVGRLSPHLRLACHEINIESTFSYLLTHIEVDQVWADVITKHATPTSKMFHKMYITKKYRKKLLIYGMKVHSFIKIWYFICITDPQTRLLLIWKGIALNSQILINKQNDIVLRAFWFCYLNISFSELIVFQLRTNLSHLVELILDLTRLFSC
jgi:hypothetical protein